MFMYIVWALYCMGTFPGVFQGVTETDKYNNVKEQERKQWLADLGKLMHKTLSLIMNFCRYF